MDRISIVHSGSCRPSSGTLTNGVYLGLEELIVGGFRSWLNDNETGLRYFVE